MDANGKNGCLGYPEMYERRKKLDEQIATWERLLPELDPEEVLRLSHSIKYSPFAEDCLIVPKPRAFTYSFLSATEFMLHILGVDKREVPFHKLNQAEHTESALSFLGEFQRGDFWLIPFQFGFYHRGESMKQVRESYTEDEFGFDPYLAPVALVLRPERLTGKQWELGVNCPGTDDYLVNGGIPKAPCFHSFLGRRTCFLNIASRPNPRFGSATGFIPFS